jgi:hypothetical protein
VRGVGKRGSLNPRLYSFLETNHSISTSAEVPTSFPQCSQYSHCTQCLLTLIIFIFIYQRQNVSTLCPFTASGYAEQSWFLNPFEELGVGLEID